MADGVVGMSCYFEVEFVVVKFKISVGGLAYEMERFRLILI